MEVSNVWKLESRYVKACLGLGLVVVLGLKNSKKNHFVESTLLITYGVSLCPKTNLIKTFLPKLS